MKSSLSILLNSTEGDGAASLDVLSSSACNNSSNMENHFARDFGARNTRGLHACTQTCTCARAPHTLTLNRA